MALTSRLDSRTLLESPTRAAILQLLRLQPGLPANGIQARLQQGSGLEAVSQGALAWHLRVLEKFEFVFSRRAGWWRRYYVAEPPWAGSYSLLALLQDPRRLALAQMVTAAPGIDGTGLYGRFRSRFPRSRQAMNCHLRDLERTGLVVADRSGRFLTYTPGPRLDRLLQALDPRAPPTPPSPPSPSPFALTSPGATTPPGLSSSTNVSQPEMA